MNQAIRNIQLVAVVAVLIATIIAFFVELTLMYETKSVGILWQKSKWMDWPHFMGTRCVYFTTNLTYPCDKGETKSVTNPKNHNIGVANSIRPRNIVKSQLKTLAPVGIAMTAVIIPKKALTLAPPPMVKKWWSHTRKEKKVMTRRAPTMEV